jgi:hypothetical protein
MSGNVDANLVEFCMVENVCYPLEFHIYLILFQCPMIQCTSGLLSAISVSGSWSMSDNIDTNAVELGVFGNVGYMLKFHRYLVLFLR